ncbi:MAG: PAS domain S-box protein [Rubrivivax sp.]|nr:PAS domain S-box protein [Rubrivivax sp.]
MQNTGSPAPTANGPAPAGLGSPPPAPADPASEMRLVGARTLTLTVAVLGAVLAFASLAEIALIGTNDVAAKRALLGAALLVVAWPAWQLKQRAPGPVLVGLLGIVMLGMGFNAWSTQLGVHMVTLGGLGMVIATAGPTLGLRSAAWLALLYAGVVGFLAWSETAGLLAGRAAEARLSLASRLVGHGLVAAAGLLVAAFFARIVQAALARATRDHERVTELLELGSDWTWELDAQARLVTISPSFEARTGYRRADFERLNEPGQPRIVDDENWRALQAALRERRAFREMAVTYVGPDGAPMHALFSGTPVFDAAGGLTGWRGVGRNVTAEREARLAQQRTETLLNRLYEASPDAICVGRASDGRILLANAGFLAFTGLTQAEVVGRTIGELGLWPDLDEPRRVLRTMRAGDGSVRDLRSIVRLSDGREREVLVTAAGFESEGTTLAVVTLRDITEVERARRESDAILDNAGVGIALVRHNRIERANAALESMFGWAPGTLAGERTHAILPVPQPGGARTPRAPASEGASPHGGLEFEREVTRRDGRRILVRLRARPIEAAPGAAAQGVDGPRAAAGTIWVVEDITARRADELALEAAKRDAEAASRAKSAFLATMSHEIRTPLNGVVGLARLLQDERLDGSRRAEYLAHLADSARLLSGIVSDVLDLSKIESGHLQVECIDFDLHEVLQGTFAAFAALGRERGLAMRCVLAAGLPRHVRGDPVRLRQILANYLGNALKFTERGSVTLSAQPRPGGRVRLTVQDTGPGVAPELHDKLFEPFLQADSSTTRRFGGTGLGLAICRQLARLMGGEVGVESRGIDAGATGAAGAIGATGAGLAEHGGSLFWAELPLPAQGLPQPPRAPQAGAGEGEGRDEPARPLAGLRVLVAEDNAVNMLIVVAMLQRLGASVVEATDGLMALATAREHTATLHAVLMDLHMPGCDGLAATRALRAEPATAALPVFAFSAAVLDHERRAAEAAGMNGFIAKPVEVAELLRVLAPLAGDPTSTPSGPAAATDERSRVPGAAPESTPA